MKRFKIKPDSGPHFFWVQVFNNSDEMNNWYAEYCIKCGKDYDGVRFGGMLMPYEIVRVLPDGTEERKAEIGTVLLSKTQLGMQTVCHELMHCAFWNDRLNGNDNACYGPSIGEDEERVLYALSELVRQCVSKLQKLGYKITAGRKI